MGKDIAHGRLLDASQQDNYRVAPMLVAQIAAWGDRHGIAPAQMRILDWGCGRGRTMFWLRDRGYQAYGADIDPTPIENGRPLARTRGLDADQVLTVIGPEGRTVYPDDFFDLTTSFQVFEHVQDVDLVARELARITRPGGGGIHVFPPALYPYEGHLGMPIVHWLPRGRARDALIRGWVALGVELKPPDYEGLDARTRAARYSRFLSERTRYWTAGRFRKAFEAAGLSVDFVSVESPNVARRSGALLKVPGSRPVMNWLLSRLVSTHALYRKPT